MSLTNSKTQLPQKPLKTSSRSALQPTVPKVASVATDLAPVDMSRIERAPDERITFVRNIPFILMHLLPLAAIWTGVRVRDVLLCVVLYYIRMFFITAGFHRYFAHRSFKTNRVFQFILAFGGQTAAQKGALWWAAHHRDHHKHSDSEADVHSPRKGWLWSHLGWILCEKYEHTPFERIKDFAKYPELVWLNKYYLISPIVLGVVVFWLFGASGLFIGFFLSTVLLYHGTFTINSLAHLIGKRRYQTTDDSRNSLVLALITLGEGWHNNHHYYQLSARQGFYWWEIDVSYYILKGLEKLGLVWDMKVVPERVREANQVG